MVIGSLSRRWCSRTGQLRPLAFERRRRRRRRSKVHPLTLEGSVSARFFFRRQLRERSLSKSRSEQIGIRARRVYVVHTYVHMYVRVFGLD